MLSLKESFDQLSQANRVCWHWHVLRREIDHKIVESVIVITESIIIYIHEHSPMTTFEVEGDNQEKRLVEFVGYITMADNQQ